MKHWTRLRWYNHTRLHSTLHYVSPMQFEKNWQGKAAATTVGMDQQQGCGKVGKQKPLSNFPTATTTTIV